MMNLTGEDLQEGSAATSEPSQIRKSRGHVQLDLPQRCLRPLQLEGSLRPQADLRKSSLPTDHGPLP